MLKQLEFSDLAAARTVGRLLFNNLAYHGNHKSSSRMCPLEPSDVT